MATVSQSWGKSEKRNYFLLHCSTIFYPFAIAVTSAVAAIDEAPVHSSRCGTLSLHDSTWDFFQLPLKLTESGHSGFKIPQEDGQFSFLMTPLFCEWFCLWSSRQNHVAANELCIFYLGQNAF